MKRFLHKLNMTKVELIVLEIITVDIAIFTDNNLTINTLK